MITYPTDKLQKVLLSGGCRQSNLPEGYTQVEYLENTGTQYIDTGILLSNTDVFEITFQSLNSLETSVMGAISGGTSYTSTNNLSVTYNVAGGLSSYSVYCDGNAGNSGYSWNGGNNGDGLKHTIKYNGLNIAPTLDSVPMTQLSTKTLAENNPTVTTWLFGRNNTSTGSLSQSGVRIYDVYIQGKGHFIPCRRNSDNVLGMFDLVTNTFFTNAGTGTFTAGANVVPTPDNPIDIVCNNGVVKVKVSKNLFNKDLVPNENRYINSTGGDTRVPTSGEFRHSDYIVIKENTQYYVGIIISSADVAGLAFYNDTKTYISGISLTALGNSNNIITSPANTKYIRFSFRIDTGYNTDWQNTVYFVEGNQPLVPFMPYGQIYTDGTQEVVTDNLGNTANAERLLAVEDYKDTQEVISGSVTRNVGIKVLDGKEDWFASGSAYLSDMYNIIISDMYTESSSVTSYRRTPYSTHFTRSTKWISSRLNKIQAFKTPTNLRILGVGYPNSTPENLPRFKQWLADQYANGTPVIIVYPLATPTTEQVTPQPLAGSSVTQTTGSIDNLPVESSTIAELKKRYIGDNEVHRVYIGDNLVWENN